MQQAFEDVAGGTEELKLSLILREILAIGVIDRRAPEACWDHLDELTSPVLGQINCQTLLVLKVEIDSIHPLATQLTRLHIIFKFIFHCFDCLLKSTAVHQVCQ